MRNIVTIAHLTIAEARRRKIVLAAAVCAFAFIALFSAALFFAHRDLVTDPATSFPERQVTLALLTVVGLFAANFLSVVFALLLPIDTLSGEIDSGVMQTLAAKPISRAEIVLGKAAGHLLIALTYMFVIVGGITAIVTGVVGYMPVNVGAALPLMVLEITLLLCVAVAGGARLSTIANGIVALAFYGLAFVGGFVEQIGSLAGLPSAHTIGVLVSLISPADSVWRLGVYYMTPEIARSVESPLIVASVPTLWMVWWAIGFTVLTLAYAVRTFTRRNL